MGPASGALKYGIVFFFIWWAVSLCFYFNLLSPFPWALLLMTNIYQIHDYGCICFLLDLMQQSSAKKQLSYYFETIFIICYTLLKWSTAWVYTTVWETEASCRDCWLQMWNCLNLALLNNEISFWLIISKHATRHSPALWWEITSA